MKKFLSLLLISFLLIPNLVFGVAVFPRQHLPGTVIHTGTDWGTLVIGKDYATGLWSSLRLTNGAIYLQGFSGVLPANPNDGTGLFGTGNMFFDYVASSWRYGACDANGYPIVYLGTNIKDADGDTIAGHLYSYVPGTTTWNKNEMDNRFDYPVQIDIVHHKVHEGDAYLVSDYDADVDTAAPKYWFIVTDASKKLHASMELGSDTAGLLELLEGVTVTGNGTGLTAINLDRDSGNTTSSNFYYDPTAPGSGTRIEVAWVGAGGPQKLGGNLRQRSETILAVSEQYFIKFTPDANDAKVTINIQFYEE